MKFMPNVGTKCWRESRLTRRGCVKTTPPQRLTAALRFFIRQGIYNQLKLMSISRLSWMECTLLRADFSTSRVQLARTYTASLFRSIVGPTLCCHTMAGYLQI